MRALIILMFVFVTGCSTMNQSSNNTPQRFCEVHHVPLKTVWGYSVGKDVDLKISRDYIENIKAFPNAIHAGESLRRYDYYDCRCVISYCPICESKMSARHSHSRLCCLNT